MSIGATNCLCRLDSIRRGALATRGASSGADGTGTPATSQRRTRSTLLALAVCALIVGLVLAGGALAASARSPIASFGPDGTSGSSFSAPNALAFDQSSSRLYALDQGTASVYGTDAAGITTHPPTLTAAPASAPTSTARATAAKEKV